MAATLSYDFRVLGVANVDRALASIERRFIAHNRAVARATGIRPGTRAASPAASSVAAARAADKSARAAIAAEKKIEAARIRTEHKVARERERLEQRFAARQLANQRRAAIAETRSRQAFRRTVVGTAGRAAGGALRSVGTVAGGALALGGGFAIAGAVQRQMATEKAAAGLANQAFREGGPSRQSIQSGVMKQAGAEGIRTGLGSEGVINGLRQFTAISGRLDLGQKLTPFLGDVANATDADIGDVGKTAGQVVQSLAAKGIYSDVEILDQTKEIIAAMAGQAKVGSIEFQDLAQQMGKVMSATAGYEGKVSDLATTMGAVAQLSIAGGASSPEEAMTAIMRFRDDLIQNQDKFKKAGGINKGVKVFTDKTNTQVRDPVEILLDMLGKTKGDLGKVNDLFGIRAQKAVQPFHEAFVKGGGVKDPEKGMKAVRDLLGGVTGAKMGEKEIKESAAFRVGQQDRQFAIAVEKFNAALGEKMLPLITEMVPKFTELIPLLTKAADGFAKFVSWFASNPLKGIGMVVAGAVVKDVAAAAIGAKLSKLLTGSDKPGGGGSAAPMGAMGALGLGATIGLSVGTAILTAGIVNFESGEAEMNTAGAALNRVREASVEDLPMVKQQVEEQRKRAAESEKSVLKSLFGGVGESAANLLNPNRETEINTQRAFLAEMEAKFIALQRAADKLDSAAGKVAQVTPNRTDAPSPVK